MNGLKRTIRGLLLLACAVSSPAAGRADGPSARQRNHLAAEARALMEKKDFTKAAAGLEEAVSPGAREGELARWLPLLGRCYERLDNPSKAMAAYQEAHRLRPKSVERMLDLARVYARVDLNDRAIDLYERVLTRERRRDVVLILADLHYRAARPGRARQYAEQYLAWEPRDLAAQRLLARIEEEGGDLSAAAHRWEGILSREPRAEGYFHLGRLWTRQAQHDLAGRAFRKAEELGMTSPALDLQRGLSAWLQGDRPSAAEAWTRARTKSGELSLASFLLALQEAEAGRWKAAADEMRRAQPGATPYMRSLSDTFLEIAGGAGQKSGATPPEGAPKAAQLP